MQHLDLNFLGPFRVTLDGESVTGFASDRVRALLAYLTVESGQAHRREALAGLLWPGYPDADASASLRQTLHRLRQALGPGSGTTDYSQSSVVRGPSSVDWLLVTPQTVQATPGNYALDVSEFVQLIEACRTHRHRKLERCASCHMRLSRAAQLYRGDFLAGFILEDCQPFDEWLVLKREWLRRQALDVFVRLATYHETRAENAQALQYAYRQLELEPWREEAHRQAMRLLALDGQRSAAVAQYEVCRRVLLEELGIEPEAGTTALYERIKSGSRGSGGDTDSQVTASAATTHNLPTQITPFIGREEEVARIIELLDSPDYRLITLVGQGGVGKTRLALQVVSEQVGALEDGICFVPLAAVDRPDLIASTIGQAAGLRFGATEQPEAQLLDYLRDREMLLVLDNLEHLLDGGAGLVASILNSTRRITLLTTSRERLGLQAEHLIDVLGLPFPEADDDNYELRITNYELRNTAHRLPATDYRRLMDYSAVRLFVERARRVQAEFELSPDNAQGVLDICKLVDGLPLGVVLAAAWVRYFPTARIAESIRESLDFLASSSRDASPQHSSLRAVFTHSWNLLSDEERQVFRKLSVFRGGWTEDAAEDVAGASLYALLSLIDKSLLRRDQLGRFTIHEVLRQYASEKLDADPTERRETQARHAAYFLDLAEHAADELIKPGPDAWLERLDREHNNLRAALEWASTFRDEGGGMKDAEDFQPSAFSLQPLEIGVRMSGALWRFWYMRGHYKEGQEPLIGAVATLERTGVDNFQPFYAARVYHGAGVMSAMQGDSVAATPLFDESLRLYRRAGNKTGLAYGLLSAGWAAHDQGDYARAGALYGESLALSREAGDKRGSLLALNNLGNIAREQGDYGRAQSLFKESLALAEELRDNRGIALLSLSMGIVAWYQGDYPLAASLIQKSLKFHYELGDKLGMSNSLEVLGRVASSQGHAGRAAHLWGGAEALREAIGSPLPPADRSDHEKSVSVAREMLGTDTLKEAWAEGRALSMEHLLVYALENA